MVDLRETARRHACTVCSGMALQRREVDAALAERVLATAAQKSAGRLLLYGGQTATPLFYGYKAMRTFTNDFDFLVREEALGAVVDALKPVFDSEHGVFFGYIERVLFSLTAGHIHDWPVPDDFFTAARPISCDGQPLFLCAPEYTIMLKLRRGLAHRELFGKDAIDIINLLAAPLFRPGLPLLNLHRAARLVLDHCGREAIPLTWEIGRQLDHLPAPDRPLTMRMLASFRRLLEEECA